MKILVDADACPVKQSIVRAAKTHGLAVVMLCDMSHELSDGYSTVITVDKEKDSADLKLMQLIQPEDIAVTQDYGLAAMVLGKGAAALNPSGLVYTDGNIDGLLLQRHMGQKTRRGGGRTRGPSRRTKADDEAFEKALAALILTRKEQTL